MGIDIAGLGNALMDVLATVDSDTIIEDFGLKKGLMHLVDEARWQSIYQAVRDQSPQMAPGGSCANTIATAALLGAETTFCGQVGEDVFGREYAQGLLERCGRHHLHVLEGAPTGKCLSLITPDAERTMATTLGCAIELEPEYFFYDALASSRWFHLTGYLFTGGRMGDTARTGLEHAKKHGVNVSLDVADAWVIDTLHGRIWELIENFADVVFTNEEEARALCGGPPEEAAARLAQSCRIAVVKLGPRGALIRSGDTTLFIDPHPPAQVVDTTGAGDAFAGGFLFGLSRGLPLQRCGELAARIASKVVSQHGAVLSSREEVQELAGDLLVSP